MKRPVQKVAARQFNLGDEEVLTRSQGEWRCKAHRDLRFLTPYRTVAARKNIGQRMNATRQDAVVRRKVWIHNPVYNVS